MSAPSKSLAIMKVSPTTVIAGIIALVFIAGAFVIGIGFVGHGYDNSTTPIIATVVGMIGTTVPAMLALLKVEQTHNDLKNGLVTSKVKDALEETGVTDAAQTGNQTTPAALHALTLLLEAQTQRDAGKPVAPQRNSDPEYLNERKVNDNG